MHVLVSSKGQPSVLAIRGQVHYPLKGVGEKVNTAGVNGFAPRSRWQTEFRACRAKPLTSEQPTYKLGFLGKRRESIEKAASAKKAFG